jgi:hypothetical protein
MTQVTDGRRQMEVMVSRIPATLRTTLGDDATFGLIELLDKEHKDWSEDVLITATDRFERRLTHECALMRQDMQRSQQDIRAEIASTRIELLRWSFAFWIGQVAVLAAMLRFRG